MLTIDRLSNCAMSSTLVFRYNSFTILALNAFDVIKAVSLKSTSLQSSIKGLS